MSTIAVNAITDASGGSAASINGYTPSASNMTGRNRIINGAMMIDARNVGASLTNPGTSSVTYTLDRWAVRNATDAAVDVVQSTDSPNAAFVNSIQLDVTTADTSIAAGQVYTLQQRIEGYNVADLGFGKSGTRTFTISFWHKHTKTGTYCVGFTNSAGSRAYPAEYTQSVADTWEQSTITVTVDTTGTWLTDNGIGLLVYFVVAAGTNFHGTVDTWAAANTFATSNQVNALDSASNYFRITGVQLEVGSTASEFEHRLYSDELHLCMRYYQQRGSSSTGWESTAESGQLTSASAYQCSVRFEPPMRAAPSCSYTGTLSNHKLIHAGSIYALSSLSFVDNAYGRTLLLIGSATGLSGTASDQVRLQVNTAGHYLTFGAEL